MIQRLCKPSKTNSYFVFGPRGSGKTTWLKHIYSDENSLYIDLLDIIFFDELMLAPGRFEALINSDENKHKRVIVDEVQKFPKILDVVHSQIQKTKRQFILTGSSSRRLKQQGSNLLAGRAWVYNFYPLSVIEIGDTFNLKRALQFGGLPDAYLAETDLDAREYLNAYVSTYLQKEIQQEQWVKNLEPFRRFLSVAAQMSGKIINKSLIARDVGVDDVTVANYFEILEDTLIGWILPAYHTSIRKAHKLAPKFYFIDTGIKRALDKTLSVELLPQTPAWGDAFENWVLLEILKNANYKRLDWEFSYLRTKDDVEIDLIILRPGKNKLFIEIKSAEIVYASDANALNTLGYDLDADADKWLLSLDKLDQKFGQTRAVHWLKAVNDLFA